MSDYRRWISYIYSYENGVKKDSAGYARLELNDGKIRMTIFLNPGKRSGSAKVCCYKSRPEPPTAVFLGDFDLNVSSPVFRKECDASDMEGSGLFFQELNGLLLFGDDGSCLASSWEDEPLAPWEAEEIRRQLMERESGSADLPENKNDAGAAERTGIVSGGSRETDTRREGRAAGQIGIAGGGPQKRDARREGRAAEQIEVVSRGSQGTAENRDKAAEREKIVGGPEKRQTSGNRNETAEQIEIAGGGLQKRDAGKEVRAAEQIEVVSRGSREGTERGGIGAPEQEKAGGGPEKQQVSGSGNGNETAERIEITDGGPQDRTTGSGSRAVEQISSVSENSQGTTPGKVSASSVQPARPVTAEAAAASGGCRNAWRTENREERVFRCLTPMYPFDDSEFERGVRMEPQDIGMLPKSLWKLAGNSFLLHSFYTYQHLLFTRKRQKEGNVCFLMLPGTYNEREQHMAQMFGFTRFRPVKRQPLENGAFGYWYMEVRFENL